MHQHTETYELGLVGGEQPLNAHVVVTVRDWTERGLRIRPCTVAITWAEHSLEVTSHSALRRVPWTPSQCVLMESEVQHAYAEERRETLREPQPICREPGAPPRFPEWEKADSKHSAMA